MYFLHYVLFGSKYSADFFSLIIKKLSKYSNMVIEIFYLLRHKLCNLSIDKYPRAMPISFRFSRTCSHWALVQAEALI
ncbi:MAG: hypothetical protein CMP10_11315 [Zetaproteobacteria bacterium]|nr:hypothetical protein [Pseudobdellovibrionaceae bacterium]